MTYEIIATVTDDLGTRCIPTGIWGYSEYDLVFEVAGLTRRNPGHTFHIEECPAEDAFNAY